MWSDVIWSVYASSRSWLSDIIIGVIDYFKAIFRCKFNPCSNTLWHRVRVGGPTRCQGVLDHGLNLHRNIPLILTSSDFLTADRSCKQLIQHTVDLDQVLMISDYWLAGLGSVLSALRSLQGYDFCLWTDILSPTDLSSDPDLIHQLLSDWPASCRSHSKCTFPDRKWSHEQQEVRQLHLDQIIWLFLLLCCGFKCFLSHPEKIKALTHLTLPVRLASNVSLSHNHRQQCVDVQLLRGWRDKKWNRKSDFRRVLFVSS